MSDTNRLQVKCTGYMKPNISSSSEFVLELSLPTSRSEEQKEPDAPLQVFLGFQRKLMLSLTRGLIGITEETQVFRFLFPSAPQMASDDCFFYLGTTSGDILKMNPRTKLLADSGPVKEKFSLVSRGHQSLFCPLFSSDFFPPLTRQPFVKKESAGKESL